MRIYSFIDNLKSEYPVQILCDVLSVSRSCHYNWKNNKTYQSNPGRKTIEEQIVGIFKENRRRFGTRRVVKALHHQVIKTSGYKVRKTLLKNGLKAIQPKSFVPKTTDSRHPYLISPNLHKQRGFPEKLNETWVGNITYIPMADGSFHYLSVWMDYRLYGNLETYVENGKEIPIIVFRGVE
ncbi:IS3 family transposase [Chitinophaga sancti]|uniref:IS3 family transposase n=1 Tax=Chitinophaga sancti TaxID=1004 RepID=UPI002A756667|nr:IS3 family transposase [Chitinophaga sancti]WPQ66292.1 IS3 family transposase [Chitinophaga sancti]